MIAAGQIWKSNAEPTRFVEVYSTRPMPESVQVITVAKNRSGTWSIAYRARVVGIPADRLGSKSANGFSLVEQKVAP